MHAKQRKRTLAALLLLLPLQTDAFATTLTPNVVRDQLSLAALLLLLPLQTRALATTLTPNVVRDQFDWSWQMQPSLEADALLRPERADAAALLASVLAGDAPSTAVAAAELERSDGVATAPALSAASCAALRDHCDAQMASQMALDNTDRLPDFQVNVDFDRDLPGILGAADVAALRALPCDAFGADADDFYRVGCFLRRYAADERPFMKWHVDGNAFTANVALSEGHAGGELVAAYGGRCRAVPRRLGAATTHRGGLCHGVAPLTAGLRYSLILFFHSKTSLEERMRRGSS